MKILTVIPARGGSKGVPLKNIKALNGKPLIAYSIEYSQACSYVSRTIVSTDSERISNIARKFKAEVPFLRPASISGDDVQDFPVIKHALVKLEKMYEEIFDVVVWLRPTSPLRPPLLIEKGLDILSKNRNCSSVRSVIKSREHPCRQWIFKNKYIKSAVGSSFGSEPYNLPRQVLSPVFFQSGDIELVRRETILNGSMSGPKIMPLVIEKTQTFDLDNLDDFRRAERYLNEK